MIKMEDSQNDLRSKIMAIMRDPNMTDEEKARKRQEVMMGTWSKPVQEANKKEQADDAGLSGLLLLCGYLCGSLCGSLAVVDYA